MKFLFALVVFVSAGAYANEPINLVITKVGDYQRGGFLSVESMKAYSDTNVEVEIRCDVGITGGFVAWKLWDRTNNRLAMDDGQDYVRAACIEGLEKSYREVRSGKKIILNIDDVGLIITRTDGTRLL